MADWKNVKVRGDLHRMVAERAEADRRSVAQMTDVLLTQALQSRVPAAQIEPVLKQEADPRIGWALARGIRGPIEGEGAGPSAGRPNGDSFATADDPTDAGSTPVSPPPIEGQTTVDEMLASCPQCAGELHPAHDFQNGGPTVRCEDCGWVREPSDG